MMFNVPQYIDVEDKIAGPLTAKQLFWMIGMGAVLLVLWNLLPQGPFVVIAIPTVVAFVAFAFYRPYGMPLIDFAGHFIFFLSRPKVYTWNRPDTKLAEPPKTREIPKNELPSEPISPERVAELSRILDRPR